MGAPCLTATFQRRYNVTGPLCPCPLALHQAAAVRCGGKEISPIVLSRQNLQGTLLHMILAAEGSDTADAINKEVRKAVLWRWGCQLHGTVAERSGLPSSLPLCSFSFDHYTDLIRPSPRPIHYSHTNQPPQHQQSCLSPISSLPSAPSEASTMSTISTTPTSPTSARQPWICGSARP